MVRVDLSYNVDIYGTGLEIRNAEGNVVHRWKAPRPKEKLRGPKGPAWGLIRKPKEEG
jgi:hypothetical protein